MTTEFKGHIRTETELDKINNIRCISSDGTKVATVAGETTVKLWDVTSGVELRSLEGHSSIVLSVSFSRDGTKVASGSLDKTVKLWDVTSGKLLQTLEGHSKSVISMSFSRDGTKVASGSKDNTVKLWDVTRGACLKTLEGHTLGVLSVSFSPDGTKVASGSWDKTVKLWDVTSGLELRSLEGHSLSVRSVSFSPDGTKVASGSDDRTVKLWDVTSGVELRSLEGHSDTVSSVSFSPDGTKVASGSWDKTVKLWDLKTRVAKGLKGWWRWLVDPARGACLQTLEGHPYLVKSVSFYESQMFVVVGTKIYTYYSLENEKQLFEATTAFIIFKMSDKNLPYATIPSQYPLAFKKGPIALQVPTVRGFIVARLDPQLAISVRKQLGLPPMFPMAFYEDKIIFLIEGKVKAATLQQILTKDGDVVKLIRKFITTFGGLLDSDISTMDTADDDDGADQPQQKRPRTNELELLRLRF